MVLRLKCRRTSLIKLICFEIFFWLITWLSCHCLAKNFLAGIALYEISLLQLLSAEEYFAAACCPIFQQFKQTFFFFAAGCCNSINFINNSISKNKKNFFLCFVLCLFYFTLIFLIRYHILLLMVGWRPPGQLRCCLSIS